MKKRIYWGLGVLILLLIGAFSYVIYQQYADIDRWKKEEKAFRDKMAKMDKQHETQEQPAEVQNTEQVQPIANDDIQIADAPTENSQQNNIAKPVAIKNHLEGLGEANFMGSITILTDDELASVNADQLRTISEDVIEQLANAGIEYEKISSSIRESRNTLIYDTNAGIVDSKWAKLEKLNNQDKNLQDIYHLAQTKLQGYSDIIERHIKSLQ